MILNSEMLERSVQIFFGAVIFVAPAVLIFFVWRDVIVHRRLGKRKAHLSFFTAAALSCNILLLYSWYLTDLLLMQGHPISQATASEYAALLFGLWVSRIAIVVSALTIIAAALSERGLGRRLCIWGSIAGLVFWVLVNVVDSELVTVYLLQHR